MPDNLWEFLTGGSLMAGALIYMVTLAFNERY